MGRNVIKLTVLLTSLSVLFVLIGQAVGGTVGIGLAVGHDLDVRRDAVIGQRVPGRESHRLDARVEEAQVVDQPVEPCIVARHVQQRAPLGGPRAEQQRIGAFGRAGDDERAGLGVERQRAIGHCRRSGRSSGRGRKNGPQAAAPRDVDAVRRVITGHAHVVRVLDVRTQQLGPDEVLVGVELEMDPSLSGVELTDALEEIEQHIRAVVPEAQQVYLEPHTARDAGSS